MTHADAVPAPLPSSMEERAAWFRDTGGLNAAQDARENKRDCLVACAGKKADSATTPAGRDGGLRALEREQLVRRRAGTVHAHVDLSGGTSVLGCHASADARIRGTGLTRAVRQAICRRSRSS